VREMMKLFEVIKREKQSLEANKMQSVNLQSLKRELESIKGQLDLYKSEVHSYAKAIVVEIAQKH
jgi:cell shape-determining protein MreC